MSQYVEHLVNTSNIRLDKYLTALLDSYSRTKIRDLIDSGNVSLDGSPVKPSYILKGGEVLGQSRNVLDVCQIPNNIYQKCMNYA